MDRQPDQPPSSYRCDHVYPGHHIETALVAGTVGIVMQLTTRRGNGWWWLLPVVPLAVTIVDHAGFNATVADPVGFPNGGSTVPPVIHRLWEWTGQGHGRAWALVAVAAIGLLLDGSVLRRRTLAPPRPLPEPGTVQSTLTSASSAAPRPLNAATSAAASVVTTARQTLRTIAAGYRDGAPLPFPRRLVGAWTAADRARSWRELALARPAGPSARSATRYWSLAIGAVLVIGGAALAHVLSEQIGTSVVRVGGDWFADLLDALADWWDDLGPGGQGLVLMGGLSLLALGLLFPTTVVLAAGGAIATTTTVPTLSSPAPA